MIRAIKPLSGETAMFRFRSGGEPAALRMLERAHDDFRLCVVWKDKILSRLPACSPDQVMTAIEVILGVLRESLPAAIAAGLASHLPFRLRIALLGGSHGAEPSEDGGSPQALLRRIESALPQDFPYAGDATAQATLGVLSGMIGASETQRLTAALSGAMRQVWLESLR